RRRHTRSDRDWSSDVCSSDLAEYGSGRLGWTVRFVADVLNGTPSIVVGIFAWTWLVKPMGHFSALAGSVALAVLMVPMLARTTRSEERRVGKEWRSRWARGCE